MIRNIWLTLITVLSVGATDPYTPPKCRMLNGYEGECRHIDRCKPFFELNEKPIKTDLELLFLRQSSCGTTSSYRYKVCCPPQSEWWRELQVDPILFPQLLIYMNDRIPNSGQNNNKIPTSINRVGSISTVHPAACNPNRGSNFGQAQAAKRPAHDATALNANSYGFDDSSQKLYNNNAHRVGQTSSNGQTALNSNNLGFGNNQPRRTERPPFQGQVTTNANTYENDQSHRVSQTTTTAGQTAWNANSQGFENNQSHRVSQTTTAGQTAWNANSQGFENDQSHRVSQTTTTAGQTAWNANSQGSENDQEQRVGQTTTVAQTWNINVDGFENDQSQRVGQTSSKGPFSEHPYKFDSIPPQKIGLTTTNSQVLPIANTNGFQYGPPQVNLQTTPEVQMDFSEDNEKIEANQTESGQTSANGGDTLFVNSQGSENDQSQKFGDSPPDAQIALSVITDELENDQSFKGQTNNGQESINNPSAQPSNENAERCGVQAAVINPGIEGGEAAPEQYPWLALLEYSGGVVNCGGSLISQTHVLTAAHCVDTMRGNPTAVRLSEYNMTTYPVDMATSSDGNPRPIRITIVPIEWSKMHPQFGHSHYQHDIGLVKMTRPVDYTDFVRPICLPQTDYTKRFDIKTKLLVAGWGTDSSKIEEVKTDSRESYVPIGICSRLVKRALNSKQMCAGERPSRRPCVGDYGGPLMLETDNAYVVVGVLSYGPNQCAGGSVPDVSTNVYEYLDWINENMVDLNDAVTTIQS